MWGGFMEKAKTMAANIDQQINDSVGVDGVESHLDVPQQDGGDAWNDDFAFEDDDDDVPQVPLPKAPESTATIVPPDKDQPTPPLATQSDTPLAGPTGASPIIPVEDAPVEPTETAEDGWSALEEDPPLIEEHREDNEEKKAEKELSEEENTVLEPQQAVEDEDGEEQMQANDAVSVKEPPQAQPEEEKKDNLPSEPSESSQDGRDAEEKNAGGFDNDDDRHEEKSTGQPQAGAQPEEAEVDRALPQASTPQAFLAASSMISNLARPGALPSLRPNIPAAVSLSAKHENGGERPTTSNVTSLFSSLASAVDSALDSAVDATPTEDVTAENGGAWDDGAFDFPDETSDAMVEDVKGTEENEQDGISNEDMASPETLADVQDVPITVGNFENLPTAPLDAPQVLDEGLPGTAESTAPTTVASINVSTDVTQDSRYLKLQQELKLREKQLGNKSEQLTQLQSLWESQEQELRQKIQDTKEEAKKRIGKAKERCEAAEARLKQSASHGAQSSAQQDQLIADLRSEGEALARKQSQMEQTVRAAHGEIRELKTNLSDETEAKEKAMDMIAQLEAELKATKGSLKSAKKGESQAGQLENDLLAARSDGEMKASTILSLQQQLKELNAESKELKAEVEKTRKSAANEALQERKTLRREHNDVITDLEAKLRTTEREAGVREDALRHEVTELRKRWQDAVRRADALSMDVQSSTSPLLRQLESMERQNRVRAAAWAELENRLRSDLEEAVIQSEALSKERSEFKTKFSRLERSATESESELKEYRRTIEDQTTKISKLESQLETLLAEAEERQEEYLKMERLANEGVMRVRSEMTQTVVDSEERYRGQIEKLEAELRVEKEKRSQLESQVEDLLENTGMIMPPQAHVARPESKPKKLRNAEGQAEILAGALGLDDSDSDDETDDGMLRMPMDRDDGGNRNVGMGSFAALEQLTSRLKASQAELESLRKNLRESEKSREFLVAELADSSNAKEKLPLFEAKVKTLTEENQEMDFEIRGLRDDIADVRELYRTQLNVLLEEKTATLPQANGQSDQLPEMEPKKD